MSRSRGARRRRDDDGVVLCHHALIDWRRQVQLAALPFAGQSPGDVLDGSTWATLKSTGWCPRMLILTVDPAGLPVLEMENAS
jgi:hypothetical protein